MARLLRLLALGGAIVLAACGSAGKSSATAAKVNLGLQLANCMRSHGVPNFPDPGSNGELELTPSSGINPQLPSFKAARQACQRFAPNPGGAPRMSESQRRAAVAFAECMRSHGQPDFPDPILGSPEGRPRVLALRAMFFPIGANFDPKSPAFRQAATTCGVNVP